MRVLKSRELILSQLWNQQIFMVLHFVSKWFSKLLCSKFSSWGIEAFILLVSGRIIRTLYYYSFSIEKILRFRGFKSLLNSAGLEGALQISKKGNEKMVKLLAAVRFSTSLLSMWSDGFFFRVGCIKRCSISCIFCFRYFGRTFSSPNSYNFRFNVCKKQDRISFCCYFWMDFHLSFFVKKN